MTGFPDTGSVKLFFIDRLLLKALHGFTQTRNVDQLMKVLLQENDQPMEENSDDIASEEADADVPDGLPVPPPLFNLKRSPLDGTPWKHNEHAQQLLEKIPKPSKPMIGLPWKKVERLMSEFPSCF